MLDRPFFLDLWADDSASSPAPQVRLTPSLRDAAPATWVWCFRCERAFQRAELSFDGDAVHCAYADCGGSALDLWQWDAYRAFVGSAPAPGRGVRYPMAQGA